MCSSQGHDNLRAAVDKSVIAWPDLLHIRLGLISTIKSDCSTFPVGEPETIFNFHIFLPLDVRQEPGNAQAFLVKFGIFIMQIKKPASHGRSVNTMQGNYSLVTYLADFGSTQYLR